MKLLPLLLLVASGCLHYDHVECGDTICPVGTVCAIDAGVCLEPRALYVPETTLELRAIPCGTTAEITLPVHNYGTEPIPFTARSTLASVTVSPSTGVVEPGQTLDLRVVGDGSELSLPAIDATGLVAIETDADTITRNVIMSTSGPVASVSGALDFGEIPLDSSRTRALTVRNDGTENLTVEVPSLPANFSLLGPATQVVAPDTSATFLVEFAPPALATYSGDVTLAFDDTLCQPAPTTVRVTGRGSGDALLVDQLSLGFDPVACSEAPQSRTLQLRNNQAVPQPVDIAIAGDEMFSVATSSVTIPPSGTTTIEVLRRATSSTDAIGSHQASLTLTGAVSKTIPITMSLVAPRLTLSTTSLVLDYPDQRTRSITVANTGTSRGYVRVNPPLGSDQYFEVQPSITDYPLDPVANVSIDFMVSPRRSVRPTEPMLFYFDINAAGECFPNPRIEVRYVQ